MKNIDKTISKNETMDAMILYQQSTPLVFTETNIPEINDEQVLVKVEACGLCRTDLHIIDGELKNPKLPLIPGHQIVGKVVKTGKNVRNLNMSDRVGIPWLGHTDGSCKFCLKGLENLCDNPIFTGYTMDGGFAEYTAGYSDFCFKLPQNKDAKSLAPLLCAGLIGYRSYSMIDKDAENIGIYGFGSSAHIISQIASLEGKRIYAFTSPGDVEAQKFALKYGAIWANDSTQNPPIKLDAAIIFAPAGKLVISALKNIEKGGIVVCGGIHMSDIPSFSYKDLWEERKIVSVANLTRKDGFEFFKKIENINIEIKVNEFELKDLNIAINLLRDGKITGSQVVVF